MCVILTLEKIYTYIMRGDIFKKILNFLAVL